MRLLKEKPSKCYLLNFIQDCFRKGFMKSKRSKNKARGKSTGKLSANKESQELSQKANQLYFERKNEEAMAKVKEAIVIDPDNPAAFHLMRNYF